jgi:Ca-activated chloride channel family protein
MLRVPLILAVSVMLVDAQSSNRFLLAETTQQSANSQSEAQAKIRVNSDLVILPVTVKDRNGNLVPDLQKREFRVFDDQVEQSIDVFAAEAFPLSLVVLVDDDLKSADAEQMARSLRAVAGGISSDDEIRVCRFDVLFYAGDGFTGDVDKAWSELQDAQEHSGPSTAGPIEPINTGRPINGEAPTGDAPVANAGSRPTKALDDAIFSAAELLDDRGRDRRKAILLITDGVNGEQFNHHTYEATLEKLVRGNVSVYSLAVGSESSRRRFSRLAKYANESGGDIYYAVKSSAMEKLYSRITEQARHEYTLAYMPRGNNRNSNYHVVEVSTTREGLQVKTRQGYYTMSAPGAR